MWQRVSGNRRLKLPLGISYQSDLADADSRLLSETNNQHIRAVPAFSGWLTWSAGATDLSVEVVSATRHFREFDRSYDRPLAWNVEVARQLNRRFELAMRVEGSEELEGEPALQYGAALTWRVTEQASVTAEYLRGEFYAPPESDDNDIIFDTSQRFGVIVSVSF